MENRRKLLAFVLVCTMVLSLMPIMPASAAVPNLPVQTSVSSQGSGDIAPGALLVKFKPSIGGTTIEGIHKLIGAQKIGEIRDLKVHEVKLPAGLSVSNAIAKYKKLAGVEYAEPNNRVQAFAVPNDPFYNEQWDLPKISASQAWDITTGDQTIVAVVDTGVNYNHEDLSGKVIDGWNYAVANPAGVAGAMDDYGHGTHVAGTIGAIANNGRGIAGVSWGARILPVKVLDSTGNGYDSWVANGITYAADHGAKVINLSLGSTSYSSTVASAVSYAQGKGCIVVAAAGNSNNSTVNYPAGYPNVIAVAATTTNDQKASYSNYGSVIDIAAPGGNNDGNLANNILSTYYSSNTAYAWGAGTSMACPHVAGLAALVLSRYPNKTNSQVARMIQETADDLGAAGKDIYFGHGRINAQKAVATNIINDAEIGASITYSGNWASVNSSYASGGTYEYSAATGDSVTYPFYGTGVTWVANKGTAAGIARVYIDGTYAQDVDLYGTDDYQQLVYTKSGLALGNHTIRIEVSGARNASSSGLAVNVDAFDVYAPQDTTAPTVTSSDPAMYESNVPINKTITITFSENVVAGAAYNTIAVTDKNGPVAMNKSISGNTLTITPVSNLAHDSTCTVSIPAGAVVDATGNAIADYNLYFLTEAAPDTTPPTVAISSPANGSLTNDSEPLLSYTITDASAASVTTVTVDGTPVSTRNGQKLPVQSDGTHTVTVYAVDAAGNTGSAQATFTVDTVAPTAGATPAGGLYNSAQAVSLSASEPGSIYYTTDGTTPTAASSEFADAPINIAASTTLRFITVDVAGNQSPVYTEVYTIDTAAPTVTSSDPAMYESNVPINKTITITLSENVAAGTAFDSITLTDRSGSVAITKSLSGNTLVISPLSDLAYESTCTVSIPADAVVDAAGNAIAAYDLYFFTQPMVDVIAPTASASPAGGLYNSAQSVTLTASEPATIYYTTDGSTPTTASSQYSGLPLTIGVSTTLKFMAVDTAGNPSPIYTEVYTIDTMAPVVGISSPADGSPTNDNTPQLSYTIDDLSANVVVTVDGTPVDVANNADLGPLSDGSHTVKIMATDAAGNTGSAQSTFTVDTVAPTASAAPAGGLYNTAQAISLSASEPGAIYYTTDGSIPTAASSQYLGAPINIAASTTLRFIAVDAAGNQSPAYTEVYTIDTVAPTVTVTDPANGATGVAVAQTITITFNENIQAGSAYGNITVKNSRGRLVTINKSIIGNTLVLDPVKDLATRTTYVVTMPAGAAQDGIGNAFVSDYSFSFTTAKSTTTIKSRSIR